MTTCTQVRRVDPKLLCARILNIVNAMAIDAGRYVLVTFFCQGCPVELVGGKYALMCKEGPTFSVDKVKW